MTRRTRLLAALVAVTLAVGACGVPTDESAQIIEQERLVEPLRRVTTTTSATTLPPVTTRDFAYFLLVDSESLPRQVRQVPVPVSTDDSLVTLIGRMTEEGFREEIGADPNVFINQVREYGVENLTIDDGVATVWLTEDPDTPPRAQTLRDVAAQLVWTLTGEQGIDAVRININGQPAELPTTNQDADLTSDPVDIGDYELYNPETEAPPSTTEPTDDTTTTTTVPPDE